MRVLRAIVLMGALLTLVGCSANHNAVFRRSAIPASGATILTVDAKQRAILSSVIPAIEAVQANPDTGVPARTATPAQQRFCAEPSPDVYSVMAQALSAGGSFGRSADPTSIDAAISAAFGSAEQGSTIPRTQTVNMLRELMFRTCERYLSAGYDSTELSVQAIRDQRLMVSILAIEQLTGAVTPRAVVISAAGAGGAGATGDAIVRLDDARKARDKAVSDAIASDAAYEQANGADMVCDVIKDKPAADLTEAQKLKVDPCTKAREARTKALAERTSKTAAYDELSALARGGGVSIATNVSATAPGGLDTARSGDITAVSDVVRSIVTANLSDSSEVMMFCLRVLRGRDDLGAPVTLSDGLKATCVAFLEQSVRTASARLAGEQQLAQEISASSASIATGSERYFARFWTPTRANAMAQESVRQNLVAKLKDRLTTSEDPKADCFLNATTRDIAHECFVSLETTAQDDLIWQTPGG